MTKSGKYHGQQLKAQEVLRLYAAGERDFRGTILRGSNFRGAHLSWANFSGADIRGTLFTEAQLIGSNFSRTHAGVTRGWRFLQVLLLLAISTGASYIAIVTSIFLLTEFIDGDFQIFSLNSFPATLLLLLNCLICLYLIIKGYTIQTASIIVFSYSITVAISVAYWSMLNGQLSANHTISAIAAFTGISTVTVSFLYVGAVPFTALLLSTAKVTILLPILAAQIMILSTTGISALEAVVSTLYMSSVVLIAWRSHNINDFFNASLSFNLPLAIAFNSILGGTSFRGADLTEAVFVQAQLGGVDFVGSTKSPTTLTHVRWHGSKK